MILSAWPLHVGCHSDALGLVVSRRSVFLLLKRGVGDDCTQRIDLSAARAVVRIDEAKCCFVMYKKTLIFQTKKRHMLSRARNSE